MQNLPHDGTVAPPDEPLYCVAIPSEEDATALARLTQGFAIARSIFRMSPPEGIACPAAVSGLARFCSRVRGRQHNLYFLETRPDRPEQVIAESHDILFFYIYAKELELGRWFGQPPCALPAAELFDGLSDSVLQRQVQELIALIASTRLIEVAVYQKLSDIVNRSWS